MNISYDLEFDMDSFLTDLERRQRARKRVRLEEMKEVEGLLWVRPVDRVDERAGAGPRVLDEVPPAFPERGDVPRQIPWQRAVQEVDAGVMQKGAHPTGERRVGPMFRAVPHRAKPRDRLLYAKGV